MIIFAIKTKLHSEKTSEFKGISLFLFLFGLYGEEVNIVPPTKSLVVIPLQAIRRDGRKREEDNTLGFDFTILLRLAIVLRAIKRLIDGIIR